MTEGRLQMEQRRMAAAQLFADGLSPAQVARRVGVSRTSASRWRKRINRGEPMKASKPSGRPSLMTQDQERQVATAYRSERAIRRVTTARFSQIIYTLTGITYDPDHAGRILHRLGLRKKRKRKEPPETLA